MAIIAFRASLFYSVIMTNLLGIQPEDNVCFYQKLILAEKSKETEYFLIIYFCTHSLQ